MREILFKAKRKNWRELPKEEWWVEDLNSGRSIPASGLPRRHFAGPLRARLHAIPATCGSCRRKGKASFRQGPQLLRHLKAKKLTEKGENK